MIRIIAALISALLTLSNAYAENEIALYFIPSADLNQGESGSRDEMRGDGYGVELRFDLFSTTFVRGEFSQVTYDEQTASTRDIDFNQARMGFGATFPINGTPLAVITYAEAVNVHFDTLTFSDFNETGAGAHAGLIFEPNSAFNVLAQLGYIDVDSISGGEYKIEINANASSRFTIFSQYRSSDLENDDENDRKVNLDDFHVGAKFKF